MSRKENTNAIQMEAETAGKKISELNDDELEQVVGGTVDTELTSRVISILKETLDLNNLELGNDTLIIEDLGADSLDVVDCIQQLEEQFSISFPEPRLRSVRTVEDLCDLIAECLNLVKL